MITTNNETQDLLINAVDLISSHDPNLWKAKLVQVVCYTHWPVNQYSMISTSTLSERKSELKGHGEGQT